MRTVLDIVCMACRLLAAGVVHVVVLGLAMLLLLTPPGLCLLPAVVVAASVVWSRVRRRRGGLLLGYLEQAVRLNLPLTPMLAAVERSERGVLSMHVGSLRRALEAGEPLETALERRVPDLSARTRSLLASAQRLGRLPQILGYLVRQHRERARSERADAVFAAVWVTAVCTVAALMGVAVLIFIVPNFEKIFDDHDATFPALTEALIWTSRWLGGRLHGQVIPGAAWFLLGVLLAGGAAVVLERTEVGREWCGDIAWHVPVLHGLVRDRGLGDVCRLVAEATDAGVPLPDALTEATAVRVNAVLADRVAHWARCCREGKPLAQSIAEARLPPLLAGVLETAQDVPRALAFLARHYASRCHYAYDLLGQVAKVSVVLLMAVPVAWVVVGLFLPLVHLIEACLPVGAL